MTSTSAWQKLLTYILPDEAISVDKLEQWVGDLDTFCKDNSLKGVSFESTVDNQLGFLGSKYKSSVTGGSQENFTVFSPWGDWAHEGDKTFPTPLQGALKECMDQADASEAADKIVLGNPFMDLASLSPAADFFTEHAAAPGDQISIAQRIANWVNKHNANSTEPCIRFLVGDNRSQGRERSFEDEPFTDMFWPKVSGKRKPLITHPKARIYCGYYNPDFKLKAKDSPAIKFIPELIKRVESFLPAFGTKAAKEQALNDLAEYLVDTGIPTVSWNHGKILAINGDVLLTGGANFQSEYQNVYPAEHPEDQRMDHQVYDHQAKVVGGAAISAHKWADYFWRYLQNPAETDNNSTWWGAHLADPEAKWFAGHDAATDKPVQGVPPIKDPTTHKLPNGVATCPIRINTRSPRTSKAKVFTCSKLGNWYGPNGEINYPAQVIDAARDIVLNGIYQWSLGSAATGADSPGGRIWAANKLMGDDGLVKNLYLDWKGLSLQQLKINPTAWASRYTKTWAIAYAQESVIICQQNLVGTFQAEDESYKQLVAKINTTFELKPEQLWDGHVWPFDLMIAISQAVGAIWEKHQKSPPDDDVKNLRGVYIILTTSDEGARGGEGWDGQTPIARIKQRIAVIMKGLPDPVQGGVPVGDVDKAVARFLKIKRVMKNDGHAFAHSKIVCADKRALYIGSDNAYPSYNEEHGIWVDDQQVIGKWLQGFFQPYWDKCTEPNPSTEVNFVN